MPRELELIKTEIKNLREDLDKMMTCSVIIKRLVEQVTGANIDELVKKELEVNRK